MICKGCKEPIEQGEASIVTPSNTFNRNDFYHTECHSAHMVAERQEKDMQEQARLARLVH